MKRKCSAWTEELGKMIMDFRTELTQEKRKIDELLETQKRTGLQLNGLLETEKRMGRWLYEPLGSSRWMAGIAWLEAVELEGTVIMKRYFANTLTDAEVWTVFSHDFQQGVVEDLNFLHAIRVEECGQITPTLYNALRFVEQKFASLWKVTRAQVHELFLELLVMKTERNEVAHGYHDEYQVYDWRPRSPGLLHPPVSLEEVAAWRVNVVHTIPQKKTSVCLRMVRMHLDICEDLLKWAASTLPGFFSSPCYQAALKWYGKSLHELVRTCLTTEGCTVFGYEDSNDMFYFVKRITGIETRQQVAVHKKTGKWLEKDADGKWRVLDKCE